MKRVIVALLLVTVLLSLFAGVAFATCPEYEDPRPPGAAHTNNDHARVDTLCVRVPKNAMDNAGFDLTGCPPLGQ